MNGQGIQEQNLMNIDEQTEHPLKKIETINLINKKEMLFFIFSNISVLLFVYLYSVVVYGSHFVQGVFRGKTPFA